MSMYSFRDECFVISDDLVSASFCLVIFVEGAAVSVIGLKTEPSYSIRWRSMAAPGLIAYDLRQLLISRRGDAQFTENANGAIAVRVAAPLVETLETVYVQRSA